MTGFARKERKIAAKCCDPHKFIWKDESDQGRTDIYVMSECKKISWGELFGLPSDSDSDLDLLWKPAVCENATQACKTWLYL